MDKKLLLHTLETYKKYDAHIDDVSDLLHCDISENIFSKYIEKVFNILLSIYYTSEGISIIYYHLYNSDIYTENKMWEDLQSYNNKFVPISKEQFISYITDIQKFDNNIDKLNKLFNCDIFEDISITCGFYLFDKIMETYFTSNAIEIIDWYLYDKSQFPDLKIVSENKEEVPTETIEDIWNIVYKYRK